MSPVLLRHLVDKFCRDAALPQASIMVELFLWKVADHAALFSTDVSDAQKVSVTVEAQLERVAWRPGHLLVIVLDTIVGLGERNAVVPADGCSLVVIQSR